MPADVSISVVVLTRGRPELLKACLGSVLRSGRPAEILVGVDGEDPASAEVLRDLGPAVRAVRLPRMCRGEARNELAALARGRWLCFLDDDTVLPAGYLNRLEALIRANPSVAVFGGGQLLSPEAGRFETAVYALLASPLGAGPFLERFSPVFGSRPAGPEKFILCNLTLDSAFLRGRGLAFEGHLTSAEENILLNRMAAAGAGMLLSGDLNLVHRRRARLKDFLLQVFSCGRGRGQITVRSPRGFSAFTLLPPGALVLLFAAAALRPEAAALGLAGYAVCCCLAALFSVAPHGLKPGVAALYPGLHFSYGAGWLCGWAEAVLEGLVRRERPLRCRCAGRP